MPPVSSSNWCLEYGNELFLISVTIHDVSQRVFDILDSVWKILKIYWIQVNNIEEGRSGLLLLGFVLWAAHFIFVIIISLLNKEISFYYYIFDMKKSFGFLLFFRGLLFAISLLLNITLFYHFFFHWVLIFI